VRFATGGFEQLIPPLDAGVSQYRRDSPTQRQRIVSGNSRQDALLALHDECFEFSPTIGLLEQGSAGCHTYTTSTLNYHRFSSKRSRSTTQHTAAECLDAEVRGRPIQSPTQLAQYHLRGYCYARLNIPIATIDLQPPADKYANPSRLSLDARTKWQTKATGTATLTTL
jgi:hypothetical protein